MKNIVFFKRKPILIDEPIKHVEMKFALAVFDVNLSL